MNSARPFGVGDKKHLRLLVSSVLVGAALATQASCGGGDPETKRQLSDIQTQIARPTSTPEPTSSPTPDPKLAVQRATADDIFKTVSFALLVSLELDGLVSGLRGGSGRTPSAVWVDRAVERCGQFREKDEDSAYLARLGLWPTPHSKVRAELRKTCLWVDGLAGGTLGDVTVDAFEAIAVKPLRAALDALPDYSSAQLLRAIAERQ